MGYFNLKLSILLYGACARLNVQYPSAQTANVVHGHSRSSASCVEPVSVTSSVTSAIRHFGAMWAWPNLNGCTGATLGVEVGVGTGMTFGMVAGVETGKAGFGSGVTDATDCDVVEQLW